MLPVILQCVRASDRLARITNNSNLIFINDSIEAISKTDWTENIHLSA